MSLPLPDRSQQLGLLMLLALVVVLAFFRM